MLVRKRKDRILTLRLSDEDYQALQQASLRDGARSLSDFARESLFRATTVGPRDDLKLRIEEFEMGIGSLHNAVARLQALVDQKRAIAE
jgi:hypothetical protein